MPTLMDMGTCRKTAQDRIGQGSAKVQQLEQKEQQPLRIAADMEHIIFQLQLEQVSFECQSW